MQSAALAQAMPLFCQPVRSALQTWGCAPLQVMSVTAHTGALHMPLAQSPAVAQAMPLSSQPFWFALQTWGCAPLQRRSVGLQVGVMHVPVALRQSAALTHGMPMFIQAV
jgi:hypothetical protein